MEALNWARFFVPLPVWNKVEIILEGWVTMNIIWSRRKDVVDVKQEESSYKS